MKDLRETHCMRCNRPFTKQRQIGGFKSQTTWNGNKAGYLCIQCCGGPITTPTKISLWNQKHPEEDKIEERVFPTTSHNQKRSFDLKWEDLLERLAIKRRGRR